MAEEPVVTKFNNIESNNISLGRRVHADDQLFFEFKYNNNKIFIQTSDMMVIRPISSIENKDIYFLDLFFNFSIIQSFKQKQFYSKIIDIENKVKELIQNNPDRTDYNSSWNFQSCIFSQNNETDTLDINHLSFIRCQLIHNGLELLLSIYKKNDGTDNSNQLITKMNTYELKSFRNIKGLIELYGVWFDYDTMTYGITWRLHQILIKNNLYI